LDLPGVHLLHTMGNAFAVRERIIRDLDLTYTPPLSAPWDPIQQAAHAWEAAEARNDH
jgi:hypothetical protein